MRDRLEKLILRTHPLLVGFVAVVLVGMVLILCIAFIEVAVTIFLFALIGGFSLMLGEWIKDMIDGERRYRDRSRNVKQD